MQATKKLSVTRDRHVHSRQSYALIRTLLYVNMYRQRERYKKDKYVQANHMFGTCMCVRVQKAYVHHSPRIGATASKLIKTHG